MPGNIQAMKTQFTAIGALLLFLPVADLAFAQTPAPAQPPIKMGLWQEEVITTISGIDGVSPAPQKYTEQTCISPESWSKHGLTTVNANRCVISNLHPGSHTLSYDQQCGAQADAVVFHVTIQIDSERHMHGTSVATITAPGSARHGTWTSTITEHYLVPDCGDIKPGEKSPNP